MIESYENGLQIVILLVCLSVSVGRALARRDKVWLLLSLFYGCWVLGDLYWEIFLIFFQKTPSVFYISNFSWYASYLFLYLLLRQVMPPEDLSGKHPLPWLGVVFAVGMCRFYMQWGDYASNLVCAALMGLLLYSVLQRLMFLRTAADRRRKLLCAAILVFCMMEYLTWTISCYWDGDAITNPYFWSDTLLSLSFIPLLFGVRKAVDA